MGRGGDGEEEGEGEEGGMGRGGEQTSMEQIEKMRVEVS